MKDFGDIWNMVLAGVIGAVGWVIRRLLTNTQEIQLLEQSLENTIKMQDRYHEESMNARKELSQKVDALALSLRDRK